MRFTGSSYKMKDMTPKKTLSSIKKSALYWAQAPAFCSWNSIVYLGGVFCGLLLLRPKTLIALSLLCEMAPTRVFSARPRRFCVAGAIDLHHLAASCCVFSANRIVSAAQSADKVQIPSQAWHFVTCDENRLKPRTKRRFWSILRSGRKKTRRKTSILKLRRVKCKEVSHEMLLWCFNVSWLGSLASLVPLQCLWRKLQNPSFLKLSFAR